jgi:catechol 2,3-dioxygenase-like lactoylglutathione lyase family enzyme
MALKRMDNVGIVVDDLEATIAFFRELGLDLEGRATIEGEWAGRGFVQPILQPQVDVGRRSGRAVGASGKSVKRRALPAEGPRVPNASTCLYYRQSGWSPATTVIEIVPNTHPMVTS